ncbi:S4 domain-containing protein YaaA [Lactobacillus sp. ESL0791]|uniref:S4 domain-containing protein YaaA n=1 Tax=Lactobacillus sp. ESL0791 TaxID=2983234 RepID=UPI0023F784DE|nr:S4 domain-containing protein YaaA [Lactobacillus sp. ESL0791]MDF7637832.1 S4 domain-containing protein YaaA [Lactobacillus sp. ESL0791]
MSIIAEFIIKGEYITLSQFLKEENIISSGGQAKWYLQEHQVLLNGEPEVRRGKKLHSGDKVEVAAETYEFH